MRVLRIYHGGRDAAHRRREQALAEVGVEVVLVVPSSWPDAGSQVELSAEPWEVVELPVSRAGDVNRHRWPAREQLARVLRTVRPDLLDVHEEPVSVACRQWLAAAGDLPVVGYTAQNVDKRFPPPFAQFETAALRRLQGLYPCSRQAASVARGKGFGGLVEVLPLGHDIEPGGERPSGPGTPAVLALVGRLVVEKGVRDAVEVLARVCRDRPARLLLVGDGPERGPALALAAELGLADAVEVLPWQDAAGLAEVYRQVDVLLVPSRATSTWVEQFGRVVVEAQAAGVAVAVYASGALPEVTGGAALLAPEGDVDALGGEVARLLDQPGRLDRLRADGMCAAVATTWDAVARRQVAFYDRVLAGGSAATGVPTGRARAEREFGLPATLAGGVRRPFALPVLREDQPWTRALGAALDRARG